MTVREAIQAKYNKGELSFKELNKLYKEHGKYLDKDYESYCLLKLVLEGENTMNELLQTIKDSMYIKASKPINPSYKDYTVELDDKDFHPVYDPKYKTVTIRRR